MTSTARSSFVIFLLCLPASLGAQQLARDFFDDTVVHEIRIDMDPADWASLKLHYDEDTYYHGNVSSGLQGAKDVGIRSRGRGSRSPEKPNLDLNIDKYVNDQTFSGVSFFILKANNQDASLLHEAITFKLFRRMGLPAPREAPARLFVNGEYFGMYTIVEHVDDDFLKRNFSEHKGDLIEWQPNDYYHFEYLGADPSLYTKFFDEKSDNPDTQKFVDLVAAINNTSDAAFVAAVTPLLNPRLYLTHAAIENAVSELDGIWGDTYGMNNFFLYRFKGETLYQFIVWDKDLAFLEPERLILEGASANAYGRRLMAIPEYRDVYLSALAKAMSLMGGAGGWADQEITRLYTLIRDSATNDPHKQCIQPGGSLAPCGAAAFEQGIKDLHAFFPTRAAFVSAALQQAGYSTPANQPSVIDVSLTGTGASKQGVVPGSIVRISGVRLGPDASPTDAELPVVMNNSFVAIDGVRAPISVSSASSIDVQVPWDIPVGSTPIVVFNSGLSNTVVTPVLVANPVILATVHANGTLVSTSAPAVRGETLVIYATGLGAIDTPLGSGDRSPTGNLVNTANPPEISIGGVPAKVVFAGLSPGSVGLYQINFVVGADAPPNSSSPLQVSVEGTTVTELISLQ